MMNNKRVTMVLSLVIAIGLWIFVIGTMDPDTTRTIRDVPVTFTNTAALEEEGLSILSFDVEAVNVTVSGTKSKVSKLEMSDVTATVDASQLLEGENRCRIVTETTGDVAISDQSDTKVTVMVEKTLTAEKNIKVVFMGDASSNNEGTVVESGQKKVTVTGAQSLVNAVDHVNAQVNYGELSNELKSINAELVPVDKDGQTLDNLKLSTDNITVVAIIYKVKTVSLTVPIENSEQGGIDRKVEVPKTITIKGSASSIENIEGLTAEPIDLSDVNTNDEIPISVNLPDGVFISAESEQLYVKVTVSEVSSKTFQFNTDEIDIKDDFERNTTIGDGVVKVQVTGSTKEIAALLKDDLSLRVTLTESMRGKVRVKVECIHNKNIDSITISPEHVTVEIEE